jgi:hypothetical protein
MAKLALCIGINDYPHAPLFGCVNDITTANDFLARRHGFKPDERFVCTDERATTQGYLDRLEAFVTGIQPGDKLILWLSHHGGTVAGDEVDGRDEVLCPVDFNGQRQNIITDDQFSEILGRVPEGVYSIVIADTCFSGGLMDQAIMRVGSIAVPRFYPPEQAFPDILPIRRRVFRPEKLPRWILLSGCSEGETCADAMLGGRYRGAFSYYLIRALEEYEGDANTPTWKPPLTELVIDVAGRLSDARYGQVPTVQGPAELLARPFLAGIT